MFHVSLPPANSLPFKVMHRENEEMRTWRGWDRQELSCYSDSVAGNIWRWSLCLQTRYAIKLQQICSLLSVLHININIYIYGIYIHSTVALLVGLLKHFGNGALWSNLWSTGCCQICAYKNLTGLLQLMAKGMFGNVNWYFLLTQYTAKDRNNFCTVLCIYIVLTKILSSTTVFNIDHQNQHWNGFWRIIWHQVWRDV